MAHSIIALRRNVQALRRAIQQEYDNAGGSQVWQPCHEHLQALFGRDNGWPLLSESGMVSALMDGIMLTMKQDATVSSEG